MKYILFLPSLFVVFSFSFSQKEVRLYKPFGIHSKFDRPIEINRTPLDCNCYYENVFMSSDSIVFCKINGIWMLEINENLLFPLQSCKPNSNNQIVLDSISYDIIWKKNVFIKDKELMVFYLQGNSLTVSTEMLYYFDKNLGIVGFSIDGDKYFIDW